MMVLTSGRALAAVTVLTCMGCSGGTSRDTPPASRSGAVTAAMPAPPEIGPADVLLAAGDIADCQAPNDEATARLLDSIPGAVAVLGDNAYEDGSAADYSNCYAPSWGRHKARTKPAVGNHEYQTAGAAGYYGYFGAVAGDPAKGYYSYDVGANWHIIVLNSNCSIVSCSAGSPQEVWLRADLAANPKPCVLAYFHHPRFNSGTGHGNDVNVAPFWQALYDAGADVILNGHEHLYERFGPQTPAAVADAARGIRQFTVGTGGRSFYSFGAIQPNSEVRNNSTYGVLRLSLGVGSYGWQFVPVAGQTFTDSGTASCH